MMKTTLENECHTYESHHNSDGNIRLRAAWCPENFARSAGTLPPVTADAGPCLYRLRTNERPSKV